MVPVRWARGPDSDHASWVTWSGGGVLLAVEPGSVAHWAQTLEGSGPGETSSGRRSFTASGFCDDSDLDAKAKISGNTLFLHNDCVWI